MKSFKEYLSESFNDSDLNSEQKEYHEVLKKHGFKYSHDVNDWGKSHVFTHPQKGVAKLSTGVGPVTVQHAHKRPDDAPSNHMTTYERFESDRRPEHYKNGPRDLDDHLKKL